MICIKFDSCLKYLLSALDVSVSRLSKTINVDSSLVNRWVSGKRIPAYHSAYIEKITEYLAQNTINSFQKEKIVAFMEKSGLPYSTDKSYKEQLRLLLLEAQGFSLEQKRMEKLEKRKDILSPSAEASRNAEMSSLGFSPEDKLIFGRNRILMSALNILDVMAGFSQVKNLRLILSLSQGSNPLFLDPYWLHHASARLDKDTEIILLIPGYDDIKKLITLLKNYCFSGIVKKCTIYYLKKHDLLTTKRDLMLSPEAGMLSCFPADHEKKHEWAMLFKNKMAVEFYSSYMRALIKEMTRPLFLSCMQGNAACYFRSRYDSEGHEGPRYLLQKHINPMLLTESLFQKYLKAKVLSPEKRHEELTLFQKYHQIFIHNLKCFGSMDLFYIESHSVLSPTEPLIIDGPLGACRLLLDDNDKLELLENMVELLQTHEKYQAAFIPLHYMDRLLESQVQIAVKSRYLAFMEVEAVPSSPVRYIADDPLVLQALEDYIREIWSLTSPAYRMKDATIAYLKSLIAPLKDAISKKL